MLDIHWLNTFVTLARLQHFGQTATELHMTQPNVSLHLKNLEQATRVKLIERSPFRLTQAGEHGLGHPLDAVDGGAQLVGGVGQ